MIALISLQAIANAHLRHISIPNVSSFYSISVDIKPDSSSSDDPIAGPAVVSIVSRKTNKTIQQIKMQSLTLFKGFYALGVGPTGSSPSPYGNTYSFVFQDFDFDGHQDLAICKDNSGGYGAPAYDVLRWNPKRKQFVKDDLLSRLSSEHLGLLVREPVKRELICFDKDGAAWHKASTYKWLKKKLILVKEEIDDATGDQEVITIRSLIGSHWKTSVRRQNKTLP